jgi:hypothetical protein
MQAGIGKDRIIIFSVVNITIGNVMMAYATLYVSL